MIPAKAVWLMAKLDSMNNRSISDYWWMTHLSNPGIKASANWLMFRLRQMREGGDVIMRNNPRYQRRNIVIARRFEYFRKTWSYNGN